MAPFRTQIAEWYKLSAISIFFAFKISKPSEPKLLGNIFFDLFVFLCLYHSILYITFLWTVNYQNYQTIKTKVYLRSRKNKK